MICFKMLFDFFGASGQHPNQEPEPAEEEEDENEENQKYKHMMVGDKPDLPLANNVKPSAKVDKLKEKLLQLKKIAERKAAG